MNDPNWSDKAFIPLVERLNKLGANARLPHGGESPDAYVVHLMGWMLDVLAPNDRARATAYWKMNSPAFRDVPPVTPIETPKASHIDEAGRSFKIEGAVVDGQKFLPGEPLPPKEQ